MFSSLFCEQRGYLGWEWGGVGLWNRDVKHDVHTENQALDRTKIKPCCLIFPQYSGYSAALAFKLFQSSLGLRSFPGIMESDACVLHQMLSATSPGQIKVLKGPQDKKGELPGFWGLYGLGGTHRSHPIGTITVKQQCCTVLWLLYTHHLILAS